MQAMKPVVGIQRGRRRLLAAAGAAALVGLGGCGGGGGDGGGAPAADTPQAPAQAGIDPAETFYRYRVIGPGFGTVMNARGQVAGQRRGVGGVEGTGFFFDGTTTHAIETPSGAVPEELDLNDSGQVIGSYQNAEGRREAFSWTRTGGFVRIAPPSSRVLSSRARDVNNAGQVVGTLVTPEGEEGFLWSASTGLLTRFGAKGTHLVTALRINDSGLVAGEGLFEGARRPVVVDAATGVKTRIDSGGRSLQGDLLELIIHLNNAGDVAGTLEGPGAFFSQPLKDKLFIDLDPLVTAKSPEFDPGSFVTALNEKGQITITRINALRSYFWSREDGLIEMGPAGADTIRYFSLNRHGTAVGAAEEGPTYAVGWTRRSGPVDLNTRVLDRPADMRLLQARSINDEGFILTNDRDGQVVLLTPVAK